MKIQVTIKNVYGNETTYPACEKAKHFAELLGQSTLTKGDISLIKRLGFEVEVIQLTTKL